MTRRLAKEIPASHASRSARCARYAAKRGTMTFGSTWKTKICWPNRMRRALVRKASTVAEAPNRQASAISTASPASGLASDSPASPVADRATA